MEAYKNRLFLIAPLIGYLLLVTSSSVHSNTINLADHCHGYKSALSSFFGKATKSNIAIKNEQKYEITWSGDFNLSQPFCNVIFKGPTGKCFELEDFDVDREFMLEIAFGYNITNIYTYSDSLGEKICTKKPENLRVSLTLNIEYADHTMADKSFHYIRIKAIVHSSRKENDEDSGLSIGIIVGIVIAGVVVITLSFAVGAVIYSHVFAKRNDATSGHVLQGISQPVYEQEDGKAQSDLRRDDNHNDIKGKNVQGVAVPNLYVIDVNNDVITEEDRNQNIYDTIE